MRKINATQLAELYEMTPRTLYNYLFPYRAKLNKLATTYTRNNAIVVCRNYNARQLSFIVKEVFKGELPYGYAFNGISFVEKK